MHSANIGTSATIGAKERMANRESEFTRTAQNAFCRNWKTKYYAKVRRAAFAE